jgi:uncharacterized protein YbaR (Trm112 family)
MSEKAEPSSPISSSALLASVVDQLACPACLAGLRMVENRLMCTGCGRTYPIVDGIPVLIAEHMRASNLDSNLHSAE